MARAEDSPGRILRPALIALTVYHLALGLFMAFAPGEFYDLIGPFGERNDHYVRDVSTFYLAFAAASALAVGRPSWRAPVLALMAIQYGLHAVNHLIDIGDTDPAFAGYFSFASVTLLTLVLAWLTRMAARERSTAA